MNEHNKLEVIGRDDRSTEYPLQQGIVHLGSAPTNDIVLDSQSGGGVAPLHAQLVMPNDQALCKLVNLAEMDIAVGVNGEEKVSLGSVLELTDGQIFRVGDFTLVFHGAEQADIGAAGDGSSQCIGLTLSLPSTQLAPLQSLKGMVTVKNMGQHSNEAQFDLNLEGLDPDCYEIAPGPLLSSAGEKDILFRLHHRGHKPAAGDWRIVIRATAPTVYPGETVSVAQVIRVLPLGQYRLRLLPAAGIKPLSTPAETQPTPGIDPESPAKTTYTEEEDW